MFLIISVFFLSFFGWVHNITSSFTVKMPSVKMYSVNMEKKKQLNETWGLYCKQMIIVIKVARTLLLLFAFSFSVHHFSETWQNLAFPFPPFLLIKWSQCTLLICTVNLVLLSQTHSFHTTMSVKTHIHDNTTLQNPLGSNYYQV